MELQDLIFVIVAILIAVALLKIFMWLLPVIVVLVIAFFILKMREYLDFCKSRMNRKLGVLLLTI